MGRCEKLEEILKAQYEIEMAEPDDVATRLRRLNRLVDQVIEGTSLTRLDLLGALRERYKDFKRSQLKADASRRSV